MPDSSFSPSSPVPAVGSADGIAVTHNNTPLARWMIAATGDEIRMLADMAGTSPQYLYQIAHGYRRASAEMAGMIELMAYIIRRDAHNGSTRLPVLSRADLCDACSRCPHVARSEHSVAVASRMNNATSGISEVALGSAGGVVSFAHTQDTE